MLSKQIFRLVALLSIVALWSDDAFAQTQKQMQKKIEITAPSTPIRKFPSEMYKAVGTAKKGETFPYYGVTQSGWYQIHYQGDLAYIKVSDARPLRPAKARQQVAPAQQPVAEKEPPAQAPSEPSEPLEEPARRVPWVWIGLIALFIAIYIFFTIRHSRQQREFEEFLRHRPSS